MYGRYTPDSLHLFTRGFGAVIRLLLSCCKVVVLLCRLWEVVAVIGRVDIGEFDFAVQEIGHTPDILYLFA